MRVIYQHTMMRRKIRRMIGLRARWAVPKLQIRPRPLTDEERQLFMESWCEHNKWPHTIVVVS